MSEPSSNRNTYCDIHNKAMNEADLLGFTFSTYSHLGSSGSCNFHLISSSLERKHVLGVRLGLLLDKSLNSHQISTAAFPLGCLLNSK
ncbi:hypothetical protein SO802_025212 [Lithocarpus litseifolius]|uniref:Uncharacterized protein n=1 Tax=Lithocarpus litseifolius TaxID=425828 RepID=A0AAW2BYL1_9ROSI